MTTPLVSRQLVIHGLVQGVGYRVSMLQVARQCGVRGWVRNRLDGSVEALAIGPREAVESFVQWARRGPAGARVDAVAETELPAPPEAPEGFALRETV